MKSLPQDNNGKTYSYDVCGKCKNICCQDAKPPLSENRKRIIMKFLQENCRNFKDPFTMEAYSYPTVDKDLRCIFNDRKTKRCIIHLVKPETCVAGPITFDINFATKKVQWFLKESSICAYAGTLFKDKAAFREHYKVAKKQLFDLIQQLSADELQTLNKIDEPETFMLGEDDLPKEVAEKLCLIESQRL